MENQLKINWNDLYEQQLEVYFRFETLEAKELSKILENLDSLYSKVLNLTSPVYMHDNVPMRNFLEISSVNTGNSITLKFKEGWKPELSFNGNHAYIRIPKNIGVPIVIVSLLFSAIQASTSLYNNMLDTQLKHLEIQIKEIELQQKLDNETSKFGGNRKITIQVNKTIRYFLENNNISYAEINGLPLIMQSERHN